ncbi:FMN-dependent NADH-azoreductase [Trichothermofontia sp.]
MAKLLYLECSPRKERSHSIAVAHAFLEQYKATHPDDTIETLDLWATDLPPFDGETLNAKYAVLSGSAHTPEQAAAWNAVAAVADRFKAADKYLFSIPMWNFSIPYPLKHYIDVITQPGLTFSFSPETGYQGLVTGKPVVVVYARGGEYPSGTPGEAMDLQAAYVKLWLGFIGFTEIHSIFVDPTLAPPEVVSAKKDAAIAQATALAASL